MGKAFIIHGAYGNPNENWFPWLKHELEKIGLTVFAPSFPTPEAQTLENWLEAFSAYKVDEESILIGHSLGATFILNFLNKSKGKVKAAFLVAGLINPLGKKKFDAINKSFYNKLSWSKLREQTRYFVYASDNDPYVPLEEGKRIAKKLDARFRLVKNAGHFNKASGYEKFDLLLEDLKVLLATDAFYRIRDIPYAISRRSPQEMKKEGRGSCYHKHIWLAEEFRKLGLPVKFVVCQFKWGGSIKMPSRLKKMAEELSPGSHLALKVFLRGKWLLVDATFGEQYKKLGFVVNEWDGESSTRLAVNPIDKLKEFESLEEANNYILALHAKKPDKEKRDRYFEKFNEWIGAS